MRNNEIIEIIDVQINKKNFFLISSFFDQTNLSEIFFSNTH